MSMSVFFSKWENISFSDIVVDFEIESLRFMHYVWTLLCTCGLTCGGPDLRRKNALLNLRKQTDTF